MAIFRIQQSKDAFCDFLLAKLWLSFLKKTNLNTDEDHDLIDNLQVVTDFTQYLEHLCSATDTDLMQFGIKSNKVMQKQLKSAYENLVNSGIEF